MKTDLMYRISRLRHFLTKEMITVLGVTCGAFLATGLLAPVLPLYLDDIGIEVDLLGLMFSASAVGTAGGELISGWLADRIGVKVAIFIGTLLYGISIGGFLLVETVPLIFLIFVLHGLFKGPVFIIGRWYMAVYSPQNAKVATIALLMVVYSGSHSLGSFISGWIAATWGNRAAILAAVVPPVLVGLILVFSIHRLRFTVASAREKGEPSPTKRTPPTRSGLLKRIIIIGGVAALQFTCFGILRTFLPLFTTESIGAGVGEVGILFGIQGMMQIVVAIPLGRMADKKGKKEFIIMGMIGIILALFGVATANSFHWLLVFIAGFSIAFTMFSNTATAYLSELIPRDRQGISMGVYGVMESTGLIVGPAFAGWVWKSFGSRPSFLLGSVFSGLGLLAFILIGRGIPRGSTEKQV